MENISILGKNIKLFIGTVLLFILLVFSNISYSWDTYNDGTYVGTMTITKLQEEIYNLLGDGYIPSTLRTHPWLAYKALEILKTNGWDKLEYTEKMNLLLGTVLEDYDLVLSADSKHPEYTHMGFGEPLMYYVSLDLKSTFHRAYNHFYTGGYDPNSPDPNVGRLGWSSGAPGDRSNAIYWSLKSKINYKNLQYVKDNTSLENGSKVRILGHLIHLLEDMASPPHANGDPHVIQNTEENLLSEVPFSGHDIYGGAVSPPKNIIHFDDYNKYFEELSKFTRENFFSADRMFMDYQIPTLRDGRDGEYINNYAVFVETTGILNQWRTYYAVTNKPTVLSPGGRKVAIYRILKGVDIGLNKTLPSSINWWTAKNSTWDYWIDDEVAKDSWSILWPICVEYVAGFINNYYSKEIYTPPSSTLPAAPTNLQALAASSSAINLTWTDVSNNEDGFRVYRGTTRWSVTTLIATLGAGETTFSDTGLTPSTTYYYKVTAYNSEGESGPSNIATTNQIVVSGGFDYNIARKADGTIWAWGANNYGQLGDGTTTGRRMPVQVQGLTGVEAVSAGYWHTGAFKSDGTVWAWGNNAYGQLGDGTTTERYTPVQVQGLADVVDISAGGHFTVALKADGTVWAWGANNYGQLGDGTTTERHTPVQVQGLTGIESISAGYYHTVALKSDGTVWAWGANRDGPLGDGTTTDRLTPVQVQGLADVVAVSAGGFFTVALKNDSTVWAWGANDNGQLGDGTTTERHTPVQVQGLTGLEAVSAGYVHTLLLKSDGTAWAVGLNHFGQLGDGTTTARSTPVQVLELTGVAAVSAGEYHSITVKADGTIWTWGSNRFGQLGDGTTIDRWIPVQVFSLKVVQVDGGDWHTMALKSDGTVWVWGANDFGQLGDGTTTTRLTPMQVPGLSGVVSVLANVASSVALKGDGTVWAWGFNETGQLGDGTTTDRWIPGQVPGLSGIVEIATGLWNVCAVKNDGSVWAWGNNFYGQLGDGTTTNRLTPVQVPSLSGVVSVSSGAHTVALKSDGTVWSWGNNLYGQLGDGTTTTRLTPMQVSGLTGVVAVSVGQNSPNTFALKNDGTVWAWGYNANGELGDGTTIDRWIPVQVIGLSGVVAISAKDHTVALRGNGTVWAWGSNAHGQLGDGTTIGRWIPVQVSGLSSIGAVSPGYAYTVAVKSDGTVWTWGWNNTGQLGDGTTIDRLTPVQVMPSGLPFKSPSRMSLKQSAEDIASGSDIAASGGCSAVSRRTYDDASDLCILAFFLAPLAVLWGHRRWRTRPCS